MKAGWSITALGELCDILDRLRKPITKRDRISGKYPYYGATGILDYVATYIFDEKLVLIGEDGAKWGAGENTAFLAEGKYWVNNHAHVIRPNKSMVLDNWLIYYLNASDLSPFITGLTVPKLNQEKLRNIPIPIAPIKKQQQIVAILDEAFAEIDKAKELAAKNLQNARELFESYLNEIFTKTSEGWEVQPLGEIAELIDSLHKTPKYVENGEYPMVRVTDLKNGVIDLKKARRVDKSTYEEFSKRHKPNIGDLVLSRVGTYGLPAVVESDEDFCLGQNTVFIVPTIDSYWLYSFLISPNAKKQIDSLVEGTTQPTISLKSIKKISISIPPKGELANAKLKIQKITSQTQSLESLYQLKLKALDELKQSLLQKAFAGELT